MRFFCSSTSFFNISGGEACEIKSETHETRLCVVALLFRVFRVSSCRTGFLERLALVAEPGGFVGGEIGGEAVNDHLVVGVDLRYLLDG